MSNFLYEQELKLWNITKLLVNFLVFHIKWKFFIFFQMCSNFWFAIMTWSKNLLSKLKASTMFLDRKRQWHFLFQGYKKVGWGCKTCGIFHLKIKKELVQNFRQKLFLLFLTSEKNLPRLNIWRDISIIFKNGKKFDTK